MISFSFNWYYFLLFPLCLLSFYSVRSVNNKFAIPFLTLISIVFLLLIDWLSFLFLSGFVLLNFSIIQYDIRSRLYLRSAILFNLLPLVLFKMGIFSLGNQYSQSLTFNILLPFGLAFYTLQQISALVDAGKPNSKKMSLCQYLFFSFCFITLPSGPIFTYRRAIEQYEQFAQRQISFDNIALGISLFIFGLAKFTFIALPIEQYLNLFLKALTELSLKLTFTESLYIVLGSLLKLYFTFSAYSDLAIGMGLCFGLKLPVNFDSPLKAAHPVAYINSWHMSFMAFVREYVFQPVFTLSKRLPLKNMQTRYTAAWVIGVFFSFFITATWHSPSVFAIAQGTVIAAVLVSLELLKRNNVNRTEQSTSLIFGVMVRLISLLCVFTTGIFFSVPSFDHVVELLKNIAMPQNISLTPLLLPYLGGLDLPMLNFTNFFPSILGLSHNDVFILSHGLVVVHMIFAMFVVFFMPNSMQIFNISKSSHRSIIEVAWRKSVLMAIGLSLLFVFCVGMLGTEQGFIYG
jgi:alginate O-acetyltransferase complex protein AlgI